MVDSELEGDDMARRHRREKRALQDRIQAMKKSAGKLDKKKKKELEQTVAELEAELARTHLMEAGEPQPREVIETEEEIAPNQTRVSKAQRRRDKKASQEAERSKQIAQQDLLNEHSTAAVEKRAIGELLKARDLRLHEIRSDGDCLYSALAHQLRDPQLTVAHLRRLAADHILRFPDRYAPFLCSPESGEPLTEPQYRQYCADVADTKAWGGQVELQALSCALRRQIQVIQSTAPNLIVQGDEFPGEPLVLTYHRHMYGLGEHYNSTLKLDAS